MGIYTKRGHGRKRDIHQDKTIDYSKRELYKQKTMWKEHIQIKRGLHGKVERDTWKGTYTEIKLPKNRQRHIKREKGNNTKWKKGCNKLIAICSEMQ